MAKPAHRALFDASPGAASPSASHASKEYLRKRDDAEFDVGEELSGYGLQGVKVTDDELLALVEELGLGGDEAGDLVKGLSDFTDTAVTDKADKGDRGDEQLQAENEAEPKPEAAAPVAREEARASASEGDSVREAETEVADAAST
jgi:SH3 domain-binding glutamic acid-rich protein